jgi:hypothetical protein
LYSHIKLFYKLFILKRRLIEFFELRNNRLGYLFCLDLHLLKEVYLRPIIDLHRSTSFKKKGEHEYAALKVGKISSNFNIMKPKALCQLCLNDIFKSLLWACRAYLKSFSRHSSTVSISS